MSTKGQLITKERLHIGDGLYHNTEMILMIVEKSSDRLLFSCLSKHESKKECNHA